MKTDEQRRKEAEAWNNWKPGSGRRGWSPFGKPIPPMRDGLKRPMRNADEIDMARWIEEVNNGIWNPKGAKK